MTPERWKRVEEIFQSALDLPRDERRAFIEGACAGDEALREQVEALVAQYEEAGDFIEEPAFAAAGALPSRAPLATVAGGASSPPPALSDSMLNRRVGAYKIVREIGRGGMGAVYLAVRADSAFHKRVAIKLVKRGMDTDFILRRFRNERQILASLDHPNIARLLDGGTTEDGLPYFVMEYIEGQPFYRYCDGQKLTLAERLRLFARVCDAVAYAHHNLVIHRDIKPGNIIVAAGGNPKLLDFGIAKLLNPEMAPDTVTPTATGARLMTPEYASPEQAQGLPATESSDIYSLGVLLYELLTGHRPYSFRSRAPHEIARVVSEEEPHRPSQAVTRAEDMLPVGDSSGGESAPTVETVCRVRGGTPDSLRRELAGNLDNIILKALRKEPGRRYATVAQLREDVTRHLEGRPVSAPLYFAPTLKMSKAPEREESSAAGGKSIAVLPFKLMNARRGGTGDEETGDDYLSVGLADALITRLGALRRFTVRPTSSVLRYGGESDPVAAGHELGVSYVVDGRVRLVGDRVRVNVQLLDTAQGSVMWSGQFGEQFTDVLSLEDAISGQVAEALVPQLTGDERERLAKRSTDSPEAFEAYLRGRHHWNSFTEEGLAKAIICFSEATSLDPDYALAYAGVADYYNWLGVYSVLPHTECFASAKDAATKAVELDPTLAEAHAALGFATVCRDFDWPAAEAHHRRALELNPNSATAHQWLGFHLSMEARHEEAVAEMRRALELDPLSPFAHQTLGWTLYVARRYEEAVEVNRKMLEADPLYAYGALTSALPLRRLGRHEEAVRRARRALELAGGEKQFYLGGLGAALAEAGRREEAREMLRRLRALEASGRYLTPYHLAIIHCALGEHDEAVAELERGVALRDAWSAWACVDPQLDALRPDPRFRELLRRTNNPAAPPAAAAEATTGGTRANTTSLAVLPFELVKRAHGEAGGETDGEYLGIGLADALITRLSNVRQIAVRPTSAVARLCASECDVCETGRRLRVDYVLTGRLLRAGERLRATVQLVRVSDQSPLWAGQFDEDFTDLLRIQDSLSAQVAQALVPQLTGDERERLARRGTDSPEAFEAYLRGRYQLSLSTPEGFAKALAHFEQAVALDPAFALAHAAQAECYFCMTAFGSAPPSECGELVRGAANRAVELDDKLGEAYSLLGTLSYFYDLDRAGAERLFARALELNPNHTTGHVQNSVLLIGRGERDAAVSAARRAVELDPVSPFVRDHKAWTLYHARRFEEALAESRGVVESEPDFAHGRAVHAWLLDRAGRHEEAVTEAQRATELAPETSWIAANLAVVYARANRGDEARELLARLEEESGRRFVSPFCLALVRLALGERAAALTLLERALEARDVWFVWLASEPRLDPLRGEPRFQDLLKRSGLFPPPAPAATAGGGASPRGTEDEEAYKLYQAGHYFATRRTVGGMMRAVERLERAVERDPRFALAYAEMADCYALLNWYAEPPPPDAWAKAQWAALKAVEADPQLAEAHASLGFVKLHYEHDWPGAEEHFKRALELKADNPVAHRWHALSLSAAGKHDEAVAEILRAQEIAPRSAVVATAVANVLFFAGRFEEALAQCRKALEIDPGSGSTHIITRWCYESMNRCEEALAVFEQEQAYAGDTATTRLKRAHVLASCGRAAEARPILDDLIARRGEEWVTAYEIGVVLALLGDRDEAFAWLGRAAEENAVGLTYVRVDPRVAGLRDDPRFAALLRRMNALEAEPTVADPPHTTDAGKGHHTTMPPAPPAPVEVEAPAAAVVPPRASARVASRTVILLLGSIIALAAVGALAFAYFRGAPAAGGARADGLTRLTDNTFVDWHPEFSPDGKLIAFASNRDGRTEIYLMNADGTGVRRLTNNNADDDCPAWSPDGKLIAFQSTRDGQTEIYVMEADGSNQTNITNSPAEETRPAWSPDGKLVAYASNANSHQQNYDIYTARSDGSERRRLTDDPAFDNDPAWSPDGKLIAFTSDRDGRSYEIFVMNADGTGARNLTNNPGNDVKPAWSPDGKLIAFTGNRPAKTDQPAVYVMNADGSDQRALSGDHTYDDEASWSPDGTKVAFQSNRDQNFEIYLADASRGARGEGTFGAPKRVRSLAVLPFATTGATGDEQYLGVGLADVLAGRLGQLDDVTVRTPAAVRRYLNAGTSALDAGRELGVDYVLAGSVAREGEGVRASLELTEVGTGRVLWAEKFSERSGDVQTLQQSISERVARALSLHLTGDERARLARRQTDSAEAQQLYLAGRYHWGKRTAEGLANAVASFEQAIAKDPSYALAYTGLADSHTLRNLYVEPPPPDAWAKAQRAALKAVELDDSSAEAHVSLAFIKFHYERDWAGAERHFRRGLELKPNYATAHHWFALLLSAWGRHDEALAEIEQARRLDPRSAVLATAAANVLHYARRFDQAVELSRQALELDPGMVGAHTMTRYAHSLTGRHAEAFAAYERERAFAGDTPALRAKRAQTLAAAGRREEAREVLRDLIGRGGHAWLPPYEVALAHALAGDRDEAFAWLERAAREHAVLFSFVRVDPHLDALRADPRFAALLRSANIPQ